jgi:tetratricopeptide (TPR) repeat protein
MLSKLGGVLLDLRHQFAESLMLNNQALEISRKIGDRQQEATALTGVGSCLYHLKRFAESIEFHKEALLIRQDSEDRLASGITLMCLGDDYRELCEFDYAAIHYLRAEAIFMEVDNQFQLGCLRESQAAAAVELGQYAQAVNLYDQALTISRADGSRWLEIRVLIGLGTAWHRSSNPIKARQCWDEAKVVCQNTYSTLYTDEINALLDELDNPSRHHLMSPD